MHKDPRPGVFDIGTRSVRYTIGLGAITGLILSVLAHVAILIAHAEPGGAAREKANAQALEASTMAARRNAPPPPPAPTAAVRY